MANSIHQASHPRRALFAWPMRLATVITLLACLQTARAESVYAWPFVFQDEHGKALKLNHWHGRQVIMSMEYANCQFICSVGLTRLRSLQALIEHEQLDYEFVIVSLDPLRDTPAVWLRYRASRSLAYKNWYFITSSVEQLPGIAGLIGVKYWLYETEIMHDFRVLRIDTQGNVIKTMDNYNDDLSAFLH